MSADGAPGGCIPGLFVVDLGFLVCRLEDPRVLGVIWGGSERGLCPPCMGCVCGSLLLVCCQDICL